MAETRLLDYSSARPSPALIKGAGASGVMRYLCHSTGPKRLTADEVKTLHAAGLSIGVVFEDTADRAKQGASIGKADAIYAANQAKALGVPTSVPIFFAVDFDTGPAVVQSYFEGIAQARIANPVGIYGSKRVVEGVLAMKLATFAWQASAWSDGVVSIKAHLFQRQKATHPVVGTDENVVLKAFPLWSPAPKPVVKAAAVTAPKPVAKPVPRPTTDVASKGAPLTATRFHRLLRKGSVGGDVCRLQVKLGLIPSGIFGPRTEKALKAWQKREGLTPDGVFGPVSQKAMKA